MTSLLLFLLLGLLGHSLAQASLNVSSQRSNLSSDFETTAKTVQYFVEDNLTTTLGRKETFDCVGFLSLIDSFLPGAPTGDVFYLHSATGKHSPPCVVHDSPLVDVADQAGLSSATELHNTTPIEWTWSSESASAAYWTVPKSTAESSDANDVRDFIEKSTSSLERAIERMITKWSELDSAADSKSSAHLAANVLDDFSDFLDKTKSSLESAIEWTITKRSELDSAEYWTSAKSTADSKSSAQLDANLPDDFSAFFDTAKSSLESAIEWTIAKWEELDSAEYWTPAKFTADSKPSAQLDTTVLDDFSEFTEKTKSSLTNAIEWTVTMWSELDFAEYWTTAKSTADSKSSAQLDTTALDDFSAFLDNTKSSLESAIEWTVTTWSELASAEYWTTAKSTADSKSSAQLDTTVLDDFSDFLEKTKLSLASAIEWTITTWSELDSAEYWRAAKSIVVDGKSSARLDTTVLGDFSDFLDTTKSSLESAIKWTVTKWSERDAAEYWRAAKSIAVDSKSSARLNDDVSDFIEKTKSSLESAIKWTIAKWSELDSAEYWTTAKSTADSTSSAQLDANVLDDLDGFIKKTKSSLESAIKLTVTKWSELDCTKNWTPAKNIAVDSKSFAQLDSIVLGDFSDFLETTKSSLESAIEWAVTKWSELDYAEYWTTAKSTADSKSSAQLDANVLDDLDGFLEKTKSSLDSAIEWTITTWSELDFAEYWTTAKSTADCKSSAQLDANVLVDVSDFLDKTKSSLESAIEWTIAKGEELDSALSFDWTTAKSTTKAWIHESSQMTSSMLDYFSEIRGMGESSFYDAIEWASSKLSEIDSTFDWTKEKSLESAMDCASSKWAELERRILDWTTSKSTQVSGLCNTSFKQITTSISNLKTTANLSRASFVKVVGKFELQQAKSFLGSLMNWNNMQCSLVVQHWSSLEWHSEKAKALVKYFVDWTKRQYVLIKSHWSAIMGDDRLSLDLKSIWDSMWNGSEQLVNWPSWLRFLNTRSDPDLDWEAFLQKADRQALARRERQRRRELIRFHGPNRVVPEPEIM